MFKLLKTPVACEVSLYVAMEIMPLNKKLKGHALNEKKVVFCEVVKNRIYCQGVDYWIRII